MLYALLGLSVYKQNIHPSIHPKLLKWFHLAEQMVAPEQKIEKSLNGISSQACGMILK